MASKGSASYSEVPVSTGQLLGKTAGRGYTEKPEAQTPGCQRTCFLPLPVLQLYPVFFGAAGMGKPR